MLRLALASALLLPAILAPLASAQGAGAPVSLSITPTLREDSILNGGRLAPETGQARVQVKVEITYSSASECVGTLHLEFFPKPQKSYAKALASPSTQSRPINFGTPATPVPVGGTGGKDFAYTNITLTTDRNAPALADLEVVIEVVATPQTVGAAACNIVGKTASATFTIKNDYYTIMEYRPQTYLMKTGQGKGVNLGLRMTNYGNGPTKVQVKVENPGKNQLDALVPPTLIHVDSAVGNKEAKNSADIILQARTPGSTGYRNGYYNIVATFDASYDGNIVGGTPDTDSQQVTFSIQVQGVYVPGFGAAHFLGAVAILGGFAAARRRQ